MSDEIIHVPKGNSENFKTITTTERATFLGRKGGLVKSEKKKFAQRLLGLKKKGMTDETHARVYNMLQDDEYSAGEILLWLEKIREECTDIKESMVLADLYMKMHKLRFGEKHHNVNVNITADIEESEERLKKFIEMEAKELKEKEEKE